MENEPKKGYESLKAAYGRDYAKEPHRWEGRLQWILDRAQQYADVSHVTRDEVLEAWENDRTYWWPNYYKEANQPDLAGKQVVTLAEWEAEGKRLYGEDKRDWKFRCPACGHVQTPREFEQAGVSPHAAYQDCASRYGLGGKKDCMWTIGGLLRVGGRYVIDMKYCPRLIFEFADKEERK